MCKPSIRRLFEPRALSESVSVRGREFVRVTKSIPPLPTHIQRKTGARGHHPSVPPPRVRQRPAWAVFGRGAARCSWPKPSRGAAGERAGGGPAQSSYSGAGATWYGDVGGRRAAGRVGARPRGTGAEAAGGGGGCGPKLRPKATRQSFNDRGGEARRLEKKRLLADPQMVGIN